MVLEDELLEWSDYSSFEERVPHVANFVLADTDPISDLLGGYRRV
jgi:hypothetical protein